MELKVGLLTSVCVLIFIFKVPLIKLDMGFFSWRRPPGSSIPLILVMVLVLDFYVFIYLFWRRKQWNLSQNIFFPCFETLITLYSNTMTVFFVRYILLESFITYNDTFCSKLQKSCYIYIFYMILLYNQIIILSLSYQMIVRVGNCGVSIILCSFANLVPFSLLMFFYLCYFRSFCCTSFLWRLLSCIYSVMPWINLMCIETRHSLIGAVLKSYECGVRAASA